MIDPASIDRLASPWAIALLALLPLLLWFWSRRKPPALIHSTPHRIADTPGLRARFVWLPPTLRLIALALLITALARPQQVVEESNTITHGIAIQLVVDRSGSMNEPAILDNQQVRRLDAVKNLVAEFVAGNDDTLAGREGDLIGLIAFGTFADTVCPLVRDHTPLLELLEQTEISRIKHEQGTAIGDALALAAARLKSAEKEIARGQTRDDSFRIKSKAIILLTDGEDRDSQIDPLAAAQLAADWSIRVYIIGIRAHTTDLFGRTGLQLGQQMHERALTQAAETTGGRFWPVDNLADLRDIYAEFNTLEKTEIETSEHAESRELFAPLAALALGVLVLELLLRSLVLRRLP